MTLEGLSSWQVYISDDHPGACLGQGAAEFRPQQAGAACDGGDPPAEVELIEDIWHSNCVDQSRRAG